MINGKEYSYEHISVVLFGRPLIGIEGVTYSESKSRNNIYGRGDKPVARGSGNREYSGTLTIHQSEFDALQQAVGQGRTVTDIAPFEIAVNYADEDGNKTTDILSYVEINNWEKGMQSGDGHMTIDLELTIGNMELGL